MPFGDVWRTDESIEQRSYSILMPRSDRYRNAIAILPLSNVEKRQLVVVFGTSGDSWRTDDAIHQAVVFGIVASPSGLDQVR